MGVDTISCNDPPQVYRGPLSRGCFGSSRQMAAKRSLLVLQQLSRASGLDLTTHIRLSFPVFLNQSTGPSIITIGTAYMLQPLRSNDHDLGLYQPGRDDRFVSLVVVQDYLLGKHSRCTPQCHATCGLEPTAFQNIQDLRHSTRVQTETWSLLLTLFDEDLVHADG